MQASLRLRDECRLFNDYESIIKHLLETKEYGALISNQDWNRLVEVMGQVLEGSAVILDKDQSLTAYVAKDLILMRYILQELPCGISEDRHSQILSILYDFGAHGMLRALSPRLLNEIMGMLNNYILFCQGDYREELKEIISRYHPTLMHILRSGDPKGRGSAVHLYRLALKLQFLGPEQKSDLKAWYQSLDLGQIWCVLP